MDKKSGIDFVIPWVDDSDPVWQKKKENFTGKKTVEGNENSRYRDWDTLKYWFRGVEKFAPWVDTIYFVTDDQKPEWLNLDHPKLKWVNHTDFIPKEYLPTFSANPIEWNLHRIEGLSENFVYFNDDMFLISDTTPQDFFVDGLPCDSACFEPMIPSGFFSHMLLNNFILINKHFSPKDTLKKHYKKWFRAQSVSGIVKNLFFGRKPFLYGIEDHHIHIAYKKSVFDTLWKEEYDVIHNTCQNKLRQKDDVTTWSVRYWRLMNGEFYPKKQIGKHFQTFEMNYNNKVLEYLCKQKGKVICLNDTEHEENFELHKNQIIEAFEKILPEKSQFEL